MTSTFRIVAAMLAAVLATTALAAQTGWVDRSNVSAPSLARADAQAFVDPTGAADAVVVFGGFTGSVATPTYTNVAEVGTYNATTGVYDWAAGTSPQLKVGASTFDRWHDGQAVFQTTWGVGYFMATWENGSLAHAGTQFVYDPAASPQWSVITTTGPAPSGAEVKVVVHGASIYAIDGASADLYQLTRAGSAPSYTYTWSKFGWDTVTGVTPGAAGGLAYITVDPVQARFVIRTDLTYFAPTAPTGVGGTFLWTQSTTDHLAQNGWVGLDTVRGTIGIASTSDVRYLIPSASATGYDAVVTATTGPSGSIASGSATAYSPGRAKFVTVGALAGSPTSSAVVSMCWEFDMLPAATATTTGLPCGAVTSFSSTTPPKLGTTWTATLLTTSPGVPGVLALGTPISIACGACTQLVSPLATIGFTTDVVGSYAYVQAIPADPAAVGALGIQAVIAGTACASLDWSPRINFQSGF